MNRMNMVLFPPVSTKQILSIIIKKYDIWLIFSFNLIRNSAESMLDGQFYPIHKLWNHRHSFALFLNTNPILFELSTYVS